MCSLWAIFNSVTGHLTQSITVTMATKYDSKFIKSDSFIESFFSCSSILNVIKLGINVTDMEGICL